MNLYALLLRASEDAPLTLEEARTVLASQYRDYEGESGRKAFRRDRERLQAVDVPVRTSYHTGRPGVPGWYIPRLEYQFPGVELSPHERGALELATRMVDFHDVLWAPVAAAKLAGTNRRTAAGRADPDSGTDTIAVFVAPPALPALQRARARRARVTFRYRGRDRVLEPYGIANARGHWYVVGHEVGDDVPVKVFRVDVVQGAVRELGGDAAFDVPAGFDVGAHVPADLWGWGHESFEVRVAVDAEVADIVAADVGQGLTTGTLDDGRIELRFACTHRGVLVSWALGLGERAEVLAPLDVRADVVARLRALGGVDRAEGGLHAP
jgi:proteasome accessory factor B/proteasome accessory factor C